MITEITCAVDFLCSLIGLRESEQDLGQLRVALTRSLQEKFQDHWFPEKASKGSAYRAICNTPSRVDPVLASASQAANLQLDGLLPKELTLWIDPQEVSYRIGTEGSVCHLKVGSNGNSSSGSNTSSPSSNVQRAASPSSSSPSSSRSASPPMVTLPTNSNEQRSPPLFPTRAQQRPNAPSAPPSHAYQQAPSYHQPSHHIPHRSSSVAGYPYSYTPQSTTPLPMPGQYSAGNARFVPSFMQQDLNMYRYA